MALGLLSMLTPLEDRIDRWATSGNAKQILLHPEDYLRLNETKREKLSEKYDLPVTALGGDRGIMDYLKKREASDDVQEMLTDATPIATNVEELGEES